MDEFLFRGAEYFSSFPSYKQSPDTGIPVIVFAGRSNSGKSSLISALCGHKNLARASSTPGKTRLLNYYTVPIPDHHVKFMYFVDTPGYGYANVSDKERKSLRMMVDEFLIHKKEIRLIVLILDARRKTGSEEKSVIRYSRENSVPCILIRSKWDVLNQKEKSSAKKIWSDDGVDDISIPASSLKRIGLDIIKERILSSL